MRSGKPRAIRSLAGQILGALMLAVSPASPLYASSAPLEASPDGRPLSLTFADEFNDFRRWAGRFGVWRTTFGDGTQQGLDRRSLPTNGELELYVDPDVLGLNPFTVRNGVLEIAAEPARPELVPRLNNYRFTSGLITSQPSHAQTYGYFEMRAKLPRGKGLWPAFWLLPSDQSWPPEIDVMESIGDPTHVYMTAHSKAGDPKGVEARISEDSFHTFAVSWDPRELIYYVDGREAGRQPTPPDLHKPMFMLANLAVGGAWPGNPDASTRFPATFSIDYIRAYRFAR